MAKPTGGREASRRVIGVGFIAMLAVVLTAAAGCGSSANSAVDAAALTCEDRASLIRAEIDPAVANVDRVCAADSDCDVVFGGDPCNGTGCPTLYVNKKSGAALRAVVGSVAARYCDENYRAACAPPPAVHGCPLIVSPACVNGVCRSMIIVENASDASVDTAAR